MSVPFADVTVPVPLFVTVSANCESVKVAVTFATAVIGTVQVVPVLQPVTPDQVMVEPVPGVATRSTLAFASKSAEHVVPVVPQAMSVPEVTSHVPLPALVTFRAYCPRAQVPAGLAPPPVKPPARHKQVPVALSIQQPLAVPAVAIAS